MTIGTDGWDVVVMITHLYRDVMRINERETGMSQSRLEIMHELWHADELSQADLQQHLGVEGAVVTRIVKQLEAQGLVTRRPDPQDNRYTLVAMTPVARSANTGADVLKFKDAFGTRLMDGLSAEDRAHLLRMLQRIEENVRTIDDLGGFPK